MSRNTVVELLTKLLGFTPQANYIPTERPPLVSEVVELQISLKQGQLSRYSDGLRSWQPRNRGSISSKEKYFLRAQRPCRH
jgi:hypothetical protein